MIHAMVCSLGFTSGAVRSFAGATCPLDALPVLAGAAWSPGESVLHVRHGIARYTCYGSNVGKTTPFIKTHTIAERNIGTCELGRNLLRKYWRLERNGTDHRGITLRCKARQRREPKMTV